MKHPMAAFTIRRRTATGSSDPAPIRARRASIDTPAHTSASPPGATAGTASPTRGPARRAALLLAMRAFRGWHVVVLGVVSLCSLGARILWLDNPNRALIFDEQYYVNAARVILSLHVPAHANYAGGIPGTDPNHEHPPLGKLFIVAGMKLFGDNPLGWRFFSLVFGSIAILLMYWVVRRAGGGRWLAVGAAALLAVDNLMLVHGRIATLDVYVLVFMLAGVGLYLRGSWLLAGIAAGLALSTKLYAADLLIVVIILELLLLRVPAGSPLADIGMLRASAGARFARLGGFVVVSVMAYLVALTAMDAPLHGPLNPLQHTRDMVSYGSGLKSPNGPEGIASYPWQWLLNQETINYYSVNTNVFSGGKQIATHPVVAFQGLMNPFIIFLALPGIAVAVWLAWRERDRLSALAVAWFAGTFLPFVVLAVFDQRTEYLYYMVVILPAVYIAVARLFSRRFLPSAATIGWVCALGYGFWSLYPFRTWTGH
jgi:dolichyl-phosphate-mannose-protein mannosyltransferase